MRPRRRGGPRCSLGRSATTCQERISAVQDRGLIILQPSWRQPRPSLCPPKTESHPQNDLQAIVTTASSHIPGPGLPSSPQRGYSLPLKAPTCTVVVRGGCKTRPRSRTTGSRSSIMILRRRSTWAARRASPPLGMSARTSSRRALLNGRVMIHK